MDQEEMEARSRQYSNDAIYSLPLRSGKIAVFNRGGELCGIVKTWDEVFPVWYPPAKIVNKDLETADDILGSAGL